jgi:hypothetical protein
VHENVGNPALNTRPTILNNFFVYFYYFRDVLVKSLISNIYGQIINEMKSFDVDRNFIKSTKK